MPETVYQCLREKKGGRLKIIKDKAPCACGISSAANSSKIPATCLPRNHAQPTFEPSSPREIASSAERRHLLHYIVAS